MARCSTRFRSPSSLRPLAGLQSIDPLNGHTDVLVGSCRPLGDPREQAQLATAFVLIGAAAEHDKPDALVCGAGFAHG